MHKYRILSLAIATIMVFQSFAAFAAPPTSSVPTKPVKLLSLAKGETPELYLTNLEKAAYFSVPQSNENYPLILAAMQNFTATKIENFKPGPGIDAGFLIVRKDYSKLLVDLHPGNVLIVNGDGYRIPEKSYKILKDLWNQDYPTSKPYVQWFAYMNPLRVKSISCSFVPGAEQVEIPAESVTIAAIELRKLSGDKSLLLFPHSKDLENWKNRAKIVYTFDSKIQYTVVTNGAYMFVESDGMTYSCQYQSDYTAYIERMKELLGEKGTKKASTPKAAKDGEKPIVLANPTAKGDKVA